MIIPVKCVTCGHVLGNKYRAYLERVRQEKLRRGDAIEKVMYFTHQYIEDQKKRTTLAPHSTTLEKTVEALVLDELHLFHVCCRRTMLTHVDIV